MKLSSNLTRPNHHHQQQCPLQCLAGYERKQIHMLAAFSNASIRFPSGPVLQQNAISRPNTFVTPLPSLVIPPREFILKFLPTMPNP